ncbi:MAG: hypothetical protein WAU65_02705 [Candidatus Nanoarchaeia archaeon]
MNEEEKKKEIIELRKWELSSLDKDGSKMRFLLLGAWGTLFLSLFSAVVLLDKTINFLGVTNSNFIGVMLVLLIVIILVMDKYDRYLLDCCDWLAGAIRDDKILTESMPLMKWWNVIIYPKRYTKKNPENKLIY